MLDQCPISNETISEKSARGVAGIVLALGIVIVVWPMAWLAALLTVDFALRAFGQRRFSPLRWVARTIVLGLRLADRRVNAAPKVFAARLGLAMTGATTACLAFGFVPAARVLAAVLIVCATLESVFGYCVGCTVYSWVTRLPSKSRA